MKKQYIREVRAGLARISGMTPGIVPEADLLALPAPVRRYLQNMGVVGRERPLNARLVFEGRIRSKPDAWMVFRSEQYNFFDRPTRLFYIAARKMGIPATGLHMYKDAKASMVIRLAGLFKVVDARGKEMDQGETVTVFNDMCCMAPATLLDKNIRWEAIDNTSAKASFTNGHITIGATLCFDEAGDLVNFISNDRFETTDGKTYHNYPWSTPIGGYTVYDGIRIASEAKLIYHRPDGDFCYGEFTFKEVCYNIADFK